MACGWSHAETAPREGKRSKSSPNPEYAEVAGTELAGLVDPDRERVGLGSVHRGNTERRHHLGGKTAEVSEDMRCRGMGVSQRYQNLAAISQMACR